MEKQLLNKYGGRNLNKKLLLELINDIKNFKVDKQIEAVDLSENNVMKIIDNMTNKDDKPLSQKSTEIYKRRLKNLNLIQILKDLIKFKNNKIEINKILKEIEMQKSKKLKKEFSAYRSLEDFIFLNQMINNIPNMYENLNDYVIDRINKFIQELIKLRTNAKDEKTSYDELRIDWTDFKNKTKELTNDPDVPLKIKILFNLYQTFTLRDDFGDTLLTDKDLDDDINFYNIKTKEFHLNKYKGIAMAKHGKKIYKVPQYIADMITKEYNDGNKYLIGKNKTETYPQGSLVKFIRQSSKKYYGEMFGINDMRKSIITFYHNNKDIKKRKQLAEIMLNSYAEQLRSYKREELEKDE